ncbi:MAG TPA: ParA family protein [Candidatus Caccenecus avistercoris]|nr:ParA family protein [Candidatus Caccenecus avistercoris]
MNGRIIAIANQKGGVGKTTTTLNLGVALSKLNKKVLLIDFDPQSDLTVSLGYYDVDNIPSVANLMEASISDRYINIKDVILHHKENIDLIPANLDLSAVSLSLVSAMSREYTLKNCLKDVRKDYDYILIDCNPSLDMLTLNALSCADKVIIPVQSQYLAAKAMTQLMGTISRVKRQINPNLEVSGILLTLIDERTKLSKETCVTLQEKYSNLIKIFDTKIPSAIKVAEATKVGKSIFNYEPKNKVALAYMNFAKEVVKDNGKSRKQNAPTLIR